MASRKRSWCNILLPLLLLELLSRQLCLGFLRNHLAPHHLTHPSRAFYYAQQIDQIFLSHRQPHKNRGLVEAPLRLHYVKLFQRRNAASKSWLFGNSTDADATQPSSQQEQEVVSTFIQTQQSPHTSKVPSYRQLAEFLSTTCMIWLSEPLLSLVDTTSVSWTQHQDQLGGGRIGGMRGASAVLQLAAMGPATTFMDTLLYMTYFLSIATTNQVAKLLASPDDATDEDNDGYGKTSTNRWRELQLCTSRLLCIAFISGSLVTAFTWVAGPFVLQQLAGASAVSKPELIPLATGYAWLRASAAPLSVAGMVAQSFCLVTGHTRTVAQAVLVASVTNIAGDALLTPRAGMYGAAIATAVASSLSALLLLRKVYMQMQEWRQQEQLHYRHQQEQKQQALGVFPESTATKVNDPLSPQAAVPLISLPDGKSFRQLLLLSIPLCFRMWALMGSYALLSFRAAAFGPIALAAQNILVRVFYFLCALADSLGQATQSFLPATIYPHLDRTSFYQVLRRLLYIAAVAAGASAVIAQAVLSPTGTSWLLGTKNGGESLVMMTQLQKAAPYLAASLFLHPFITVTEGLVIAKREFSNIFKTYSVTLALFGFLLFYSVGCVSGVWRTLVAWQISRLANYWIWGYFNKREQSKHSTTATLQLATEPPL